MLLYEINPTFDTKIFLPNSINSVCNDCLLVKKKRSDKIDKGPLLYLATEELNK